MYQNIVVAYVGGVEVGAKTVSLYQTDNAVRELKKAFPTARIEIKTVSTNQMYTG